jgi:hypothetical protein
VNMEGNIIVVSSSDKEDIDCSGNYSTKSVPFLVSA